MKTLDIVHIAIGCGLGAVIGVLFARRRYQLGAVIIGLAILNSSLQFMGL
jgi:hypothetical protein